MTLDFTNKKKTQSKPRPFLRMLALAFVSTFVPEMSVAQNEGPVTLRFQDGRGSLTGRLTAFREGKWFMDTSVGWIVLEDDGISCVGAACPPDKILDLENAQVALTSKDGNVTIDGELIEIVDDQYVLATAVGEQRIDVAMVDCAGAACGTPPAVPVAVDNTVELTAKDGSATINGELVDIVDDQYVMATAVGEQRIDVSLVDCAGAACTTVASTSTAATESAEVELSNGALTLVGELLDVKDGAFILKERTMGDIRVSIADFACTGAACP